MHDIRCAARRLMLALALLLLAGASGRAQSFSLFDIDISSFPQISAGIVALDAAGEPIQGLTESDISVTENGSPVPSILDLDCPPATAETPMSVVLVNDRSGSMTTEIRAGVTRIELLKSGAVAFVQLFRFVPPGAVAITAFDHVPSIVSDFQTAPDPLISAIGGLTADGGTQYTPAFLDGIVGGISLLKTRPANVRRVLVFLTDGEPNTPPALDSIIAEATKANVEIHTITIGMKMTPALQRIARETGGTWHGDVASESEMEGIYRRIALISRGMKPCRLSWYSTKSCGLESIVRNVRVTITPQNLSATARYTVPPAGVTQLATDPAFVWFGETAPPATADRSITITARGGPFDVTAGAITDGKPFAVVDWGGTAPPFTLAEGESRTVIIRYTPIDTSVATAGLQLASTPCNPPSVVLTGGIRDVNGSTPLQLISPAGGETYGGCGAIMIRWAGVAPTDTVTIEYTATNGADWHTITDTATGLIYSWIPPSPGASYRIRISTKGDPTTIIERIAGGGLRDDGEPATSALLSVPAGLAVENDIVYIAESGSSRIRRISLIDGIISTVAGTGSAGNSGDGGPATQARLYYPNAVVVSGDRMYIADYANHRIREVNLTSGIIRTLAGTGESGFSGDSGRAIDAMLREPVGLALGPGALYFSDRNYRIRKIDLSTEIITTIAGAGLNEGDGGIAYRALLSAPVGLAVQDKFLYVAESGKHRIRRIDLETGIITTIAGTGLFGSIGDGGPATLARLYEPTGVDVVGTTLYITDASNNRIRRVNLTTNIITNLAGSGARGNGGDGGPPAAARMDYPSFPVVAGGKLYFSDMRNNLVRAVRLGKQPGLDSSRSTFTVAVAEALFNPIVADRPINMGTMAIGKSRDSIFTTALCNVGNAPLVVDSLYVTGTNASDFIVVSGSSSEEIAPSTCRAIELRFRPTATGARSALLIVKGSCANADTLTLTGTAVEPCGASYLQVADLGRTLVNTGRPDTTLAGIICNTGTTTLSGYAQLSTTNSSFRIINGGGAFSLTPGSCHTVTIRFTPSAVGRVTTELRYNIPGYCGDARTILFGQGATLQSVATLDAVAYPPSGCGTDPRDTTIDLRNVGGLPLIITDLRLAANNEGFSILSPSPSATAPVTIAPDETISIALRFNSISAGDKSATLEIVSNAPDSPTRIAITGRRDSFRVATRHAVLSFAESSAGTSFPRDSFVVVENTGGNSIELSGGTIIGGDASKFEMLPGQFPVVIPPGDSIRIKVRALERAIDSSWQSTLRLTVSPTCDSGIVDATLIIPGARPAVSVTGPMFRHLFCPQDVMYESSITVRNDGGDTLRITGFELRNDAEGSFSFGPPLPIVIPQGKEVTLPIRFMPKQPGIKSADLVLFSNAERPETIVRLTSVRDSLAFEIDGADRELAFGNVSTGLSTDRTITVRNTGTYRIDWDTPQTTGPFTIVSADPAIAYPGQTSTVVIRFAPQREGIYHDSLDLREIICGTAQRLRLSGISGELVNTVVSLPVDTGRVGVQKPLPIRVSIADREAFTRIGVDSFMTTVTFSGNILRLDTVLGARIVATSHDRLTGDLTVTLSGGYSNSSTDTLATLLCTPMFGDRTETPLRFTTYSWNKWNATTDTINGRFAITGECYNAGFVLAAEPKVLKIRPQPMADVAEMEIEIEEWSIMRVTLVDGRGIERATIANGYYEAGRHVVPIACADLPSGMYSVIIETPFARVSRPIILTR